MSEEWLVVNFPMPFDCARLIAYEVSDQGHVRSVFEYPGQTKMRRLIWEDETFFVHLRTGVGSQMFPVARLVLMTFNPIHDMRKYNAHHINENRADCSLANLEWDYRYGANHGRAKLSDIQVLDIRKRSEQGASRVSLAKEYGVSVNRISAIVYHESWAHIP